jgi:hypothetical protein
MSEKKIFTKRVLCHGEPEPRKKREIFSKKVFYRDKKLVADRPGYEVEEILAKHVLPGDDYNPTGETAKAAAVAVLALSKTTKDGRKKGGDHKRGKYGPMRSMVNVLSPRSLDTLLSMLRNENTRGDLPENRSLLELGYKIRIQDRDIDSEGKVLYYSVNGAEEDITFAALRNYISASKKTPFTGC